MPSVVGAVLASLIVYTPAFVAFAPFVPQQWQGYEFQINFRGRLLHIEVTKAGTTITLQTGAPLTIDLAGQQLKLE